MQSDVLLRNTGSDACTLVVNNVLLGKRYQLLFKRGFDIFFSLIGLIILSPVFIIICLIILLDSRGPVFFRQIRVGRHGMPFKIYKFRTMTVNAEKEGRQITVGADKRITRAGRFLRYYKLDELPQLINVLLGEMSFVGPRPEVPRYVELYTEYQRQTLLVRPGITDYASIEFRNENSLLGRCDDPEMTYIKEIMPQKIELNIKYLLNISMATDFKLIFFTIIKIFK
jgi:lipopolysaccharide/colanic/teichoic acid biosynthesis glycosyltransferase